MFPDMKYMYGENGARVALSTFNHKVAGSSLHSGAH